MKFLHSVNLFFLVLLVACQHSSTDSSNNASKTDNGDFGPITLVIHGGAGTIEKSNMTDEMEIAYKIKLKEALNYGYSILENGGTSLDAVTGTIQILENSPLFNAGKGAVFTNEERNELDASIMDGSTGKAGAIAGVTTIKNPILAARAVMDNSPHVMMAGKGAEKFAKNQGLEMVSPDYFYNKRRHDQLMKIKQQEDQTAYMEKYPDYKFGTVGCVALDAHGNIAAGTSTGGMTNKKYGRVGDSPIIGAGTYADNTTCGVSATGYGEFFIRNVVAYDIAAHMKYANMSVQDAAEEVIMKKLYEQGGTGGVIALDRHGNIAMPFNTSGMYRGFINKKDKPEVFIYGK